MENSNKIPTWLDISDYSLIKKDHADLIIEQSEKSLNAKINSLERLTDRSDKILAIYITICTIIGSYLFKNISSISDISQFFKNYLLFTASFALFFSLFGIWYCWKNINPYLQADLGEEPKDILNSNIFKDTYKDDYSYSLLTILLCIDIQARLKHNDFIISKKSRNNKKALQILLIISIIPIFCFLFQSLLYSLHFLH